MLMRAPSRSGPGRGRTLPQKYYDVLGPILPASQLLAIGGDWKTWFDFYVSTPVNCYWLSAPNTGNGFHDLHHARWLAGGRDPLYAAGASYDFMRVMYGFAEMHRAENPLLADKFFQRANAWAQIYCDFLSTVTPPWGITTPFLNSEGITLYALVSNDPAVVKGMGLVADRHTNFGYSLSYLRDPTDPGVDNRERARSLIALIMAWVLDSPSDVHASYGTEGNTLIPIWVDALLESEGFLPNATQTQDDTPRIDHPGTYRHHLHDYVEKPFMDSLFNDALIFAHRLCPTLLSSTQRTNIVNAVAKNVDFITRFWDELNLCYPYPEATYSRTDTSTGEGVGPSPDSNNQHIEHMLWLHHVTGNVTYKNRADTTLHGALLSPVYSGNLVPAYGSNYLPKQFSEHYKPINGPWYRQATPLATPTVPVNTARPTISGTASAGSVLTCNPGSWANAPSGQSFAWMRVRKDNMDPDYTYTDELLPLSVGTNSPQYTVVSGDVGRKLQCVVTATNAAGASVPESTAKTAVIT